MDSIKALVTQICIEYVSKKQHKDLPKIKSESSTASLDKKVNDLDDIKENRVQKDTNINESIKESVYIRKIKEKTIPVIQYFTDIIIPGYKKIINKVEKINLKVKKIIDPIYIAENSVQKAKEVMLSFYLQIPKSSDPRRAEYVKML